jgi:hypothetical protein
MCYYHSLNASSRAVTENFWIHQRYVNMSDGAQSVPLLLLETTKAYRIKMQFSNTCTRLTRPEAVYSQTQSIQLNLYITGHPTPQQYMTDTVFDAIIHSDVAQ